MATRMRVLAVLGVAMALFAVGAVTGAMTWKQAVVADQIGASVYHKAPANQP